MRLFVFGFGYSARAVAARLRPRLEAAWGTTRDPAKLTRIGASGVTSILFDAAEAQDRRCYPSPSPSPQGGGERALPPPLWGRAGVGVAPQPNSNVDESLATADHVLVSIAPDEAGDPVLRHFRETSPPQTRSRSSISPPSASTATTAAHGSTRRANAGRSRSAPSSGCGPRRSGSAFAEATGVPVAIVRLAGIYGPGRGPFEKIRRGTARRIVRPGQVFNRIHVEDIAAIVEAAFDRRANGIFNGSDDEPAPPQDVLEYAAEPARPAAARRKSPTRRRS